MTIHVYHQSRQPPGKNHCSHPLTTDATCSHFCFPSPRSWDHERVTCACPAYLKLSSDKRTCTSKLDYTDDSFETNFTVVESSAEIEHVLRIEVDDVSQMVHIPRSIVVLVVGLVFALTLIVPVVVSRILFNFCIFL